MPILDALEIILSLKITSQILFVENNRALVVIELV